MSELPPEPTRLDFLPEGWYRGGNQPGVYLMGMDERVLYKGTASAFIEASGFLCELPEERSKRFFGTICQNFFPMDYLGTRIRLSAWLRYDLLAPTSWCAIWVKIDYESEEGTRTFIDNMGPRRLTGTSDGEFVPCEIVADVGNQATNLTFGFLLCGVGSVWADNFQFEIVDDDVPLTR